MSDTEQKELVRRWREIVSGYYQYRIYGNPKNEAEVEMLRNKQKIQEGMIQKFEENPAMAFPDLENLDEEDVKIILVPIYEQIVAEYEKQSNTFDIHSENKQNRRLKASLWGKSALEALGGEDSDSHDQQIISKKSYDRHKQAAGLFIESPKLAFEYALENIEPTDWHIIPKQVVLDMLASQGKFE